MNPITSDQESLRAIRTDPNFVQARRFSNDINQLEVKYPDECPENVIAKVLMLTEEELRVETEAVVKKLRDLMGVDV